MSKETPRHLYDAFSGDRSFPHAYDYETVEAKASEFVHLAYIFNCHEYFKGKKVNGEPLAWGDALRAIDITKRKRLKICQLLKSLQCIRYNTDVRGWLTDEQYEKWERKEHYEKFHETLQRMIHFLALHILGYDSEDYKNAKWG